MKKVKFLLVITLVVVVLITFPRRGTAMSGKISNWSPDKRVPGYLDDTFTPFLIADQNRTIHAFATQRIGGKRAIVYRQWTLAGDWTRPIDILFSPTGGDAQILDVFLASDGIFHMIFFGNADETASIYYASVLATNAGDSSAWSFPELIGEGAAYPSYGTFEGDNQGNFVVVYNGNHEGNGIYITKSNDMGLNWSTATPLYLINDPRTMPYYIKSYVGRLGRVHVVWGVNIIEGTVYDSLYYAGIDIKTGDLNKPQLLDKRPNIQGYFGPSEPTIVDNGKYVVIMYNGGNPFKEGIVPVGRPTILVRFSNDDGETWEDVKNPFPFLTGQSGEQVLLVDSSQVVHAIAIMRIDSLVDGKYQPVEGVWHSEFKDGIWSYPQRFVTTIPAVNLRAVVSQGNLILATWMEDALFGQNGIWYSYTTLDSPELPATPLPIHTVFEEVPTIMNTMTITENTLPSTGTPRDLIDKKNTNIGNPQLPILIGIIPAVILVFVIIIRTMYIRRK